ncbi:MAG: substrate-binding domain-containing protein [Pseudomonadota bacterium]
MPSHLRNISRIAPVFLLGLLFLLSACDTAEKQGTAGQGDKPIQEILIYCGITMAQPVMEIAAMVEKEKNCTVKISYGESEWLKNTSLATRVGDIYFPGAPSYLQSMIKDGTVKKTVEVGQNRIVLMVQKGNPKQVQPDLRQLLRKDLQIVLGTADAGSIGRETQYNLDKLGIYKQAIDKALYLTADSKGLAQALRSKDADVVVNWRAVATFKDNIQYMDTLPLPDEQTEKRLLVMGLLSFSKHTDLAEYFLARSSSDEGRAIFKKYGF